MTEDFIYGRKVLKSARTRSVFTCCIFCNIS